MSGNWKFDFFFCVHSPINANPKRSSIQSTFYSFFAIRFSIYFLVNFPEHYLTHTQEKKIKYIRISHRATSYTQILCNLPIKLLRKIAEKKEYIVKRKMQEIKKKEDE